MSKLIDGLATPYPADKNYRPIERVRYALMAGVYPDGADDVKASRVLGWVLQGDLRSLLPGMVGLNGVFSDGPNTLDLTETLARAMLPQLEELRPSLQALDLGGSEVLDVLGRYMASPLPQRRVEVYCAVACLCALRRSDV